MPVPLVDVRPQYESVREELEGAVLRVLESGQYVQAGHVAAFEQEFAAYCESAQCVAVNSGTSALHLALAGLGIGPGDQVITVSHTFIATAEAISATGAVPVFVDIDPDTWLMDPVRVEAAITPRTRAIVPVHLYGQVVDMAAVLAVAADHGIPVIEDACQAHGALYQGRRAGSLGTAGCFSFYPSKNLGTIGEGGAVVTDSAPLALAMRRLREHGQSRRYIHEVVGHNYRMGELQAAALRVKLPHLDAWNDRRRAHAGAYDRSLDGLPLATQAGTPGCLPVHHLYVVRVAGREHFRTALAGEGVETGVHYPVPVHLQHAYASLGYAVGSLPVTEAVAREVVSLPMYAELADHQIDAVTAAVTAALPAYRRVAVRG